MIRPFDVVIIGSGAGGAACAWGLVQAGLKVLILESGPRFNPEKDYITHQEDWQFHQFPYSKGMSKRHTYDVAVSLDKRYDHLRSWNYLRGFLNKSGQRRNGLYQHVQGVGGSTLHFSGEAHRLNPKSMQMKSRFDVGYDWPLSYSELEPYYERAEKVCGLSAPLSDSHAPRAKTPPLPPHKLSYASQSLGKGFKKLGLDWQSNSLNVVSRPYDGRPACNYCGTCDRGCRIGDKGSADVTFIRKAEATGHLQILTKSPLIQIVVGSNDRVASLVYTDNQGRQQFLNVGDKIVVMAAGAVETPRLLLASTSTDTPNGVANESGQVGRNFMETLSVSMAGIHPEKLGSYRGHPSDAICWAFNEPDAVHNLIGGFRITPATSSMGFNTPIAYSQRVVGGWGDQHLSGMKELFGRVVALSAIGEALPNLDSYISLDGEKVDSNGLPLAKIRSRLDEMAIRRLSVMMEKVEQILKAADVEQIIERRSSYDTFASTHVFGTCLMGSNPNQSVVNPNGRSHRWRNLYICDASVFPSTGGGEAPSLTIQALALRTAGVIAHLR